MDGGVETERAEDGALLVLLTLLIGAVWTASLPLALLSGLVGVATVARRRSVPMPRSASECVTCGSGARVAGTSRGEPDSIAAMSLALRRLEAELYALDDQRLTDRAGGDEIG